MKVIIASFTAAHDDNEVNRVAANVLLIDESLVVTLNDVFIVDMTGVSDAAALETATKAIVISRLDSVFSVTVTEADIIFPGVTPSQALGFSSVKVRRANGTEIADPLIWQGSATVASGQAVYHPTSDGTGSGAALFDEVTSIMVTVDGISQTVSTGLSSVSGDKKTVTLNARQLAIALGLISLSTNANGQKVDVVITGSRA